MKLDRIERQRVDRTDRRLHHGGRLAGQTQNEMGARTDSAFGSHLDGPAGAGEIVSAIDRAERRVVTRLDSVLDRHVTGFGQPGEIVELRPVDAVGTRSDDDPRHLGQFESLRENLFQPLQRSIRIRKRLEIGQIPFGRTIATAMELDPFLELSADALVRSAVGRRESRVVAERATARGERAVAIGTSEPGMYGQLLHAKAEQTAEIAGIAVIAPVVAPRISHRTRRNTGRTGIIAFSTPRQIPGTASKGARSAATARGPALRARVSRSRCRPDSRA